MKLIAGKAVILLILAFMTILIAVWWANVIRFFFYQHIRATLIVLSILAFWYVVGRAILAFDVPPQVRRRGDDDCA